MNRAALAMGIGAAAVSLAVVGERSAQACGGCFQPPTQTASDVTDERMLLSVSPLQTTLYDQIRYAGNPSSFAWVLPIHGTVDVGLSADVLFDSADTLTQTQIQAPPLNCPVPDACQGHNYGAPSAGFGGSSGSSSGSSSGGGVTVIKAQNVGPYATVQLSTNGNPAALNAWLTQNGFDIPANVVPTLDAYVTEGFDFLAMKLLPDQGVQSMRPVRVTTTGASLSLPLRMAAIGTGATVGITIWVVADGRYEPQNFPFFHIDDSKLVWDWSTSSSNYTTLRQQNEQALDSKGWEFESSISLNEQVVETLILNGGTTYYGGSSGSSGSGGSDASQDYLPITNPDGTIAETADQVRADDLKTLFAGMAGPSVRFTRIRSDISHAAMTTDFVLQASSDQSEVTNIRQVTQSINEQCPIYGGDCSIIGTGSAAQAAASGPQYGGIGSIWGNGGGSGGMGVGIFGGQGAMSSSGTKGSGCSATSQPSDQVPFGLTVVAGVLGLASLRSRRARGNSARR
jgi:hypothetical protein